MNADLSSIEISTDINANLQKLSTLFSKDDTFLSRQIQNQKHPECIYLVAYCGGMVDNGVIGESIIKPLALSELEQADDALLEAVTKQVLLVHNPSYVENYQDVVEAVTYGDTVLFVPGARKAVALGTQGFPLRGIAEPNGEAVLSGPKEGFCESLVTNLSLIHRRLRTNDLKLQMRTFGTRSRTKACICYLDSLIRPKVLQELNRRLDTIAIDGVLDANYLNELVRDNAWSPFRCTGYTERPDIVVGKLLEGRIAIFLDGTPVVLTIPYLFIENFQSNEDYYLSFYYTSFSRLLRMAGFFLTITVPAVYLSITTYHHELLPTPLLLSIASERLNVPFPMALELLLMLTVFDILRETGVRMPAGVGQAMSVVGALVLGSAAVEANIVSSLVIIVVALTGITSLLVPKLNASTLIIRLLLFAFAVVGGFSALTLGGAIVLTHILRLKSFGVWQISLAGELQYQNNKDIAFRAPFWQMRQRPSALTMENKRFSRKKLRWWR